MNIKDITQGPVKSVAELISLREQLEENNVSGPSWRWAYRGQPRDFGALTPSFQRQFHEQVFGAAELIEDRLIDAFRTHYAELRDRSSDMPLPAQIGSGHDMRCLSVMQHYEIPTRLLDWTTNFWTAIYFACASDPGIDAELWYYDRVIFQKQREGDASLNAFIDRSSAPVNEPALRHRRGENLLVEIDPQISPRMRQQFAHHTVSTRVFSDHAPALVALQNEINDGDPAQSLVHRVLIDGTCKSKALQFLAEPPLNITASTIFPDVVGLGRFLRWQFDTLRTMLL